MESLKNMFVKIGELINKVGKEQKTKYIKLRPIHCLDITNIIGENVVSGAVRRTSLIMLIDPDDKECIEAKNGLYYQDENGIWKENLNLSHRKMSNNSIFYQSKPTREFWNWHLKQMRYSGEPGFINAEAGKKRRPDFEGLNPCSEILLRDAGMCNLTSNNVMGFVENGVLNREALLESQRLSARMGIRTTCVDFELHNWDVVQKEDRLLGCSLMGWQDMINATNMSKEDTHKLWQDLRSVARDEADRYAEELNVPKPLLATTFKPDGSIAQLPTVSSGIHFAHSPYFIRRVRISSTDPIVKVCEELGYSVVAENGQDWETCNTKVVAFPVKAPMGKTKYDVSALEQLEIYKASMTHYVDHNTSITVHAREHEWQQIEQWMWDNWDDCVGISFLSLDDNFYPLLPYEAITEEEYSKRVSEMKPFIPSLISKYEVEEMELDSGSSDCATGACPVK